MHRHWKYAFTLLVTLCAASLAQAQGGIGPYPRTKVGNSPTVSPYLNLTRGGNPAINYYGVVKPQQEASNNLHMLQNQFQNFMQQPQGLLTGPLEGDQGPPQMTTGHRPSFGNTSHFYSVNPGVRSAPGGPGSGPAFGGMKR